MRFVPALDDDAPKYVGDVWIVEEVDHLGRVNMPLGVFDTIAGAREFSSTVKHDPRCTMNISKIAYYATDWVDINEE